MRAINLINNKSFHFDKNTTPEWAVAYAYCAEKNMISWLFQETQNNNDIYQKLPMIYGKKTVACGDWCSMLPKEGKAHKKPTYNELVTALKQVQEAIARWRDSDFEPNEDGTETILIHPKYGPLSLEEVKYCIVDKILERLEA